jgi:cellulose biosynthesis protein BcsQ
LQSLLGVAAVKDGLRVASLDLDRNTRNLSSFLTLRRASRLESPDHVMLMDMEQDARTNARPSIRAVSSRWSAWPRWMATTC